MNDQDILKMAQENPQEVGEYEKQLSNRAVLYGFMAGIIILLIMIFIEWIILKKIDFGKPALLFGISFVIEFYDGIKQKSQKSIIWGVLMAIMFIVFLLAYIGALFV